MKKKRKINIQNLKIDEERRDLLFDVEKLKNQRNETSKQIPLIKKKVKMSLSY